MSGQYTAMSQRALALITKKGAPVTFPDAIIGTPDVYDPLTDVTTLGTPPSDATGRAVEIEGDPDRFAALSLVLVDPVTLLVAAFGLAVTLTPGMPFLWANKLYTIKDPNPFGPDGIPILYTLTGSR